MKMQFIKIKRSVYCLDGIHSGWENRVKMSNDLDFVQKM